MLLYLTRKRDGQKYASIEYTVYILYIKEFRLRSNIAIIFPKRAMELLKENTKNDAGVEK